MSASAPTNVSFSFREFSRRGAADSRNPDGWGVAYFEDGDARVVREPVPTDQSACVRFLLDHALSSSIVMSHVRRATQGARRLANTQPFTRELGGRVHAFAHNGNLEGLDAPPAGGAHQPIGDTDSERAFCALLGELARIWREPGQVPSLDERFGVVAEFAARLRPLGPANFLYSDGDALFAHGHRRTQPARGDAILPPGLHLLTRSRSPRGERAVDATGAEAGVALAPTERVALFASVPLTDEPWRPLDEGEVIAARGGAVVRSTARER
ncbi:MAG: class II glutamine amidotransferase [Sorangiineae bacterium]|nr:class II glutamine amidotransferase [Sorangiineae bacterium]